MWDSATPPPSDSALTYRWTGYSETAAVRSLLRYVEVHGDRLRRKYVTWIRELGLGRIRGKSLIEHLVIEHEMSYWWMTLLAEQNPWKSPSIVDAIRLLALEEILVEQQHKTVRLVSRNRRLANAVNQLCQRLGIRYEWEDSRDAQERRRRGAVLYRALPAPVRGLVALIRFVSSRWSLKRSKRFGRSTDAPAVFLCSYFDNVDPQQEQFHSFYWSRLPDVVKAMGYRANWLHLFVRTPVAETPRAAAQAIVRFNRAGNGAEEHALLDSYVSWRVALRVLKRWFDLARTARRLSEVRNLFEVPGSRLSLWPLLSEDWYESVYGPTAVANLLYVELFEEALRDLPHQPMGLYLCEDQAWERALISAWRRHGHGRLVAVVHSAIRFWDLRYFGMTESPSDAPEYFDRPDPDVLALNGQAAVEAYRDFPKAERSIVECEALRYGYLADFRKRSRRRDDPQRPTRVLILGEYTASGTAGLLRLVEAAVPHLQASMAFVIKPHPNCAVDPRDYPSLKLDVLTDPLGRIMSDYDVVYSGNLTTAAVDAYLAGLRVVIRLDETTLNFSPLRGRPGVVFVATPDELASALQSATPRTPGVALDDFFFLDPELSRWKCLLAS